jgi:CPA2 family monovalent cation:H+ antiporter-2
MPNAGVTLLAFGGLLVAARLLIPRMLAGAARTRSHELFVFVTGLIILGAAFISSAAGLSLALGAFVAGIVVADNAYSHQVLTEVLPFRESFVGLFFTSVGMLLDPSIFATHTLEVAAWLAVVWAGKIAVVLAVGVILRYSWPVALRTAFALAQGGEFSFVLAGAATRGGLLGEEHYQLMVAVAVLSMMTAPFVFSLGTLLAERLRNWPAAVRLFGGESRAGVHARADGLASHVIIVGFGLNGRRLAASLRHAGVPALALEIDPGRLQSATSPIPLLFGDASSAEVLDAAGLERAIALVVAVSDLTSTQRILQTAQRLAPDVPVIARTRHLSDVAELYRLGAREVVVEEVEASLEILLLLLGIAGLDQRGIRAVIAPYLKGPRAGRPPGRPHR